MPSTHSSLICHIVYSTKDREKWFLKDFQPKLHAYIGGILRGYEATAYAAGGIADQVHLLLGLKTTEDIPASTARLLPDSTLPDFPLSCGKYEDGSHSLRESHVNGS